MTELMWTALSENILALASYAITAALLIFGLKGGISVGKSIWRSMTDTEEPSDYYDDSDERSERQAEEMFGGGPMPGLMGNGYEDNDEFTEDDEVYANSSEFNDR